MGIFGKVLKAVAPAAGQYFGGPIGGAIGAGVAGLVGDRQAANAAEEAFERNADLQREFAQHGIQWRVEDAKAAGVHPVYALGAGGAAFAPVAINPQRTDWGAMGQNMARAVAAQSDEMSRRLQEAQLKVLESEARRNDAAAVASLGGRGVRVQAGDPPAFPAPYGPGGFDESGMPTLYGPDEVLAKDAVKYRPVAIESARAEDPSMAAGPAAAAVQEFAFAPGSPLLLPSKDAAERLESLSESWELTYAFLQRGYEVYGQQWLDKMKQYFPVSSRVMSVIKNLENAASWVSSPSEVESAFTGLGHRAQDWVRSARSPERGPTVSGRIRR